MKTIYVASEDEVSEAVCERLLNETTIGHYQIVKLRKGGFGYLKSKIKSFVNLSRMHPVILLTDLDFCNCPVKLIKEWTKGEEVGKNLIFRVAVREVEAWLLGDREGMAQLLGISPAKLPRNPENLPDPKRRLLEAAASARRKIRSEICAEPGAASAQGIGYNQILSEFALLKWSPSIASENCESLRRAILRIRKIT